MEARKALLAGDMDRFGALMVEAHVSFRDDFAASCEEVDLLVAIAMQNAECFGARITGGGFGGCTVNVVRAEAAEKFVATVRQEYSAKTGIDPDCFVCAPADGAFALAMKGGTN
jgi:galactokinase